MGTILCEEDVCPNSESVDCKITLPGSRRLGGPVFIVLMVAAET